MLISTKALKGYELECKDGEIGKVKEFYFDDKHWTVRYLVADTGPWLVGRKVLISPQALNQVSEADRHVVVNLTKLQIQNSPSLDSDQPVSRQYEQDYYGYYGWPTYWTGPYLWGYSRYLVRDNERPAEAPAEARAWDPELQSTRDITGQKIQAGDGELGHIEDFIIDDATWAIRYLVLDTLNWWPGKKVLISPSWVDAVSWKDSKVYVNLSRETIKLAPEYTGDTVLDREYEAKLHDYYERKGYWVDEPGPKVHAL